MKIEEIIKSSREIEDKYHRTYLNIIYSAIWLEQETIGPLKRFDLTHPQYNVMRIVNGYKKPIAVASIQQRMLFKTSNVTRIIDRLVSKAFLTKEPSNEDRRVVLVNISEAGKNILAQIHDEVYNNVEAVISKNLSFKETVLMGELLDKMRD